MGGLGILALGTMTLGAGTLGAGAALAQEAQQKLSADSVIEKIKQRGSLVVGLATFVPWAMLDKNGELIGFEIEVARQLAKDMGVKVEFVPTAWDGIIPALLGGKFDVIISGMSITPARNLTVNFSEPYAYSGIRIAVSKKLEGKIKTMADLNSPDITFSQRRGATPVATVQRLFPKAKMVQFDDEGATWQELLNGKADAVASSEPAPSAYVADYPDKVFMPADDLLDPSAEAIALRKGDPDALNFFNNWIAGEWRSGFLKERHDYWFRTTEWRDQVAQ
jgi:polar amino acid transport system substrate-binding protein